MRFVMKTNIDREALYRAFYEACLEATKVVDLEEISWFGRNHKNKTFTRLPTSIFGEVK